MYVCVYVCVLCYIYRFGIAYATWQAPMMWHQVMMGQLGQQADQDHWCVYIHVLGNHNSSAISTQSLSPGCVAGKGNIQQVTGLRTNIFILSHLFYLIRSCSTCEFPHPILDLSLVSRFSSRRQMLFWKHFSVQRSGSLLIWTSVLPKRCTFPCSGITEKIKHARALMSYIHFATQQSPSSWRTVMSPTMGSLNNNQNLHAYIYIYMYVYDITYTCTHNYTCICISLFTYMYLYIYAYML